MSANSDFQRDHVTSMFLQFQLPVFFASLAPLNRPIRPINSSSDVESDESRVNPVILLCIPSAVRHELCALSKKRTCRTRSPGNCVICI